MGNPLLAPEERFLYRNYRTWPDEERWELIGGKAFSMSPAPSTRHQDLQAELITALRVFLRGKPCKAFDAPFDLLLPAGAESDDEVDTVVQPDILVICDRDKITEKGARGAPDLVIEIVSPRTARRDYETKYHLYEGRGVREYWIVDPKACAIHAWRLGTDGAFGEECLYEEGRIASSAIEGFSLKLEELFAV